MRIANISQPWARALPPSESVAIWSREVGRRLVPEHEVTIWSRRFDDEPARSDEGVEYRTVEAAGDWRRLRALEPLARLRGPRKPAFSSRLYHGVYHAEIAAGLGADPPDVVHVHNFSQAVPIVREACPDAAIVLHMHCEWLRQLDRRMIERRAELCDAILGCSDFVTASTRAAFPELAGRCHTAYNGVDVDAFRPAPPRDDGIVRILAAGRLSPEKGAHVLVEAFGLLAETCPAVELHLVGDDGRPSPAMLAELDDRERVRALLPLYRPGFLDDALAAIPAAARERIVRHGALPHAELPAIYAASDIVVSASVCEEPFGMSNAEAGAAGLPAVTSAVGGAVEVVEDGVNGLHVPPADAPALAAALERLVNDAGSRRRLGAAGRERAVERFSWDVVAAGALAVYEAARPATSS